MLKLFPLLCCRALDDRARIARCSQPIVHAQLILVLAASIVLGSPLARAEEAAAGRTLFAEATPVSPQFRREVDEAVDALPDDVWHAIQRAGWRLIVAEFVVDAAPSLRGQHPRGWPAGTTWEHSDAVHLPYQRLLILGEKRRNKRGEVVVGSRALGVMRHELGHAFDMASGGRLAFRSSWPDFTQCYWSDVAQLGQPARERLRYYLQGGIAGRQEAFAEAFALHLGGGSDAAAGLFRESFPQVMQLTASLLPQQEAVATVEGELPAEDAAEAPSPILVP